MAGEIYLKIELLKTLLEAAARSIHAMRWRHGLCKEESFEDCEFSQCVERREAIMEDEK